MLAPIVDRDPGDETTHVERECATCGDVIAAVLARLGSRECHFCRKSNEEVIRPC